MGYIDDHPEQNPWEDDLEFDFESWQWEVRDNNTRLGYRDWVQARREEKLCDEDFENLYTNNTQITI